MTIIKLDKQTQPKAAQLSSAQRSVLDASLLLVGSAIGAAAATAVFIYGYLKHGKRY